MSIRKIATVVFALLRHKRPHFIYTLIDLPKVDGHYSYRRWLAYPLRYMIAGFLVLFSIPQTARAQQPGLDSLANQEIRCDDSLWNHIFMKYRLRLINRCQRATGVIIGTKKSGDGDVHFLLKLDKGQEQLLNKKNKTKQNGCLVLEPICITKVHNFWCGKACVGYVNNVTIPKIGDRVEAIGSFVKDGVHGWNELHPITKITILNK